jgi:hypothetical protein
MPRVLDPATGKSRTVAAADLEAALEEGYELDTPDVQKRRAYEAEAGAGEALKSVGEGLLGGATLGLSDVALAEIGGDEYRERRRLRDETFDGLHTASEVVGGVAPVLLSGGSGLAARAAAMSPAALAARGGALAERTVARIGGGLLEGSVLRKTVGGAARFGAAGAAEGAAAGAGFALSEGALADDAGGFDSLAERAWSGAKDGALLGLIGGAAIGGLGGAAIGGARKLAQRYAKSGDELVEAANERAFKVMSPRFTDARKLGTEKIQQIGEDIRNYTLRDGRSLLEAFDNTESFAPKMSQARHEVTEELGALRARAAADPTPVDAREFLRRVDSEVLDDLRKSESPEIRRRARRVDKNLEQLRADVEEGVPVTYGRLLDLQKKALAPLAYEKLRVGGVALQAPGAEYLTRTERILDQVLGSHVERVLAGDTPTNAVSRIGLENTNYLRNGMRDLAEFRRAYDGVSAEQAELIATGQAPTQWGKPFDPVEVHLYPGEAPILNDGRHRMTAAREAGAEHVLARVRAFDDQLNEVSQTVGPVSIRPKAVTPADDVTRYREVKRLAESFIKSDELLRKTNPQNKGNRFVSLTDYMTGLGAGAALFDGGMGALGGLAVSLAHKQARERGSALLATLYTRSRNLESAMNSKLGEFFKRARADARRATIAAGGIATGETIAFDMRRALAANSNETEEDAYDRVVARAQDIASGRAVGPYVLDDHAPQTANAMRQVQIRAAKYLLAHAPVPPQIAKNPNLGALNGQTRPSKVALYDFARRVRAVERPETIIDDLNAGTLSMAAVDAVRNVHPQTYAWMRARVLDGLGDSKELLPYQYRIRLGVQFELPTDPSLRPDRMAAAQSVYAALGQQPAQQKPMPGGTSPRSKRVLSMAEELEIGEEI